MPPIWLITMIAKTGIPSWARKATAALVMAAIVALTIAAIWWMVSSWLEGQRSDAVALDRADISAEAANRVLEADRSANLNASVADNIAMANEKEIDDAVRASDNSSVGPGVGAVLERMRRQQEQGRR